MGTGRIVGDHPAERTSISTGRVDRKVEIERGTDAVEFSSSSTGLNGRQAGDGVHRPDRSELPKKIDRDARPHVSARHPRPGATRNQRRRCCGRPADERGDIRRVERNRDGLRRRAQDARRRCRRLARCRIRVEIAAESRWARDAPHGNVGVG